MESHSIEHPPRKSKTTPIDKIKPLQESTLSNSKEKIGKIFENPFQSQNKGEEYGLSPAILSSVISFGYLFETLSVLDSVPPMPNTGPPSLLKPHICTSRHLQGLCKTIGVLGVRFFKNAAGLLPIAVDSLCWPQPSTDPRGVAREVYKKINVSRVKKYLETHRSPREKDELRRNMEKRNLDPDFLLMEDTEFSSSTEIYKYFFKKVITKGQPWPSSFLFEFTSLSKSIRKVAKLTESSPESFFSSSPNCLGVEREASCMLDVLFVEKLSSTKLCETLGSVSAKSSRLSQGFALTPGDSPFSLELSLDMLEVLYKEKRVSRTPNRSFMKTIGSGLGIKPFSYAKKKNNCQVGKGRSSDYFDFANCFEDILNFNRLEERYLVSRYEGKRTQSFHGSFGSRASAQGIRAILSKLVNSVCVISKMYYEYLGFLCRMEGSNSLEDFRVDIKYKIPKAQGETLQSREGLCIFRKTLTSFASGVHKRQTDQLRIRDSKRRTLRAGAIPFDNNVERKELHSPGNLVCFDKWSEYKSRKSINKNELESKHFVWSSDSSEVKTSEDNLGNADQKSFEDFFIHNQEGETEKPLEEQNWLEILSTFNLWGLATDESKCNYNLKSQSELLEVLRLPEKLEDIDQKDSRRNDLADLRVITDGKNLHLKRKRKTEDWSMGESGPSANRQDDGNK